MTHSRHQTALGVLESKALFQKLEGSGARMEIAVCSGHWAKRSRNSAGRDEDVARIGHFDETSRIGSEKIIILLSVSFGRLQAKFVYIAHNGPQPIHFLAGPFCLGAALGTFKPGACDAGHIEALPRRMENSICREYIYCVLFLERTCATCLQAKHIPLVDVSEATFGVPGSLLIPRRTEFFGKPV